MTSMLNLSDPLTMLVVLGTMAVAPFLLTMITSFVKIVVVCGIIRSALGTQQIPPNQVITGLALILTIYVMWPVGASVYEQFNHSSLLLTESHVGPQLEGPVPPHLDPESLNEKEASSQERLQQFAGRVWDSSRDPIRRFLLKHTHEKNRVLFVNLETKLAQSFASESECPAGTSAPPELQEMIALVPAFVISELTEAFQIGFIIFVPFLILDLVVSNLLLAMGMFMLSPTTVSLPLKLMLFVLVDGWTLIITGLVTSYT